MSTKASLDEALEAAVRQQFITLFLVLMAEASTSKAIDRFEAGVRRLIENEAKAAGVIERLP